MPIKIYVAVTIALVALSSFVTARIVASRGSGHELAFRVQTHCEWWARELEKAAEAYEAHARVPTEKRDLPFGATHFERIIVGTRLMAEQKFCRVVRDVEAPDRGMADIDDAGAAFASRGDDPNKQAQAMRSLAEAAKRTAALEIAD